MKIDYPAQEQIPKLRRLWKEAFSDNDGFLDAFFSKAFAPDRCRCVTVEGEPAAALYWFDCQLEGQPVAYIYAFATALQIQEKQSLPSILKNSRIRKSLL